MEYDCNVMDDPGNGRLLRRAAPHGRARVTQRDVARALGVSVMTVSSALAGRPGVKRETRRRVQRAAKKLGYRRHALASWLRTRESHVIGAIVEDLARNPCSMEIMEAFEAAARAARKSVLLGSVSADRKEMRDRLDVLLELRVGGIVEEQEGCMTAIRPS